VISTLQRLRHVDPKRFRSGTAVALLAMMLSLSGEVVASVSMSPPRTRLSIAPGSHGRQTITIRSLAQAPVTCSVRSADWTIENGTADGLRYHAPGTCERSCTPWIQVWPDIFELPPGGQQDISLSVALPEDAEGSYFSALILDVQGDNQDGGSGFLASTRINYGHLITVDTAGRTVWSAEIEDFRVSRPDDTSGLEMQASIRNLGTAGLRPEGFLAVVDAEGVLVGRIPLKTYFAQPGGTIQLAEVWEGLLKAGVYRAIGAIDIGGDQTLAPEVEFRVTDRIELTGVEIARHDSRLEANVGARNLGNLTAVLSIRIRVSSASGVPIGSFAAGELTVLPGATAVKPVDLGILPPGRYELEVLAENEAYRLQTTEQFQVP
jgi:hypothetical protein